MQLTMSFKIITDKGPEGLGSKYVPGLLSGEKGITEYAGIRADGPPQQQ